MAMNTLRVSVVIPTYNRPDFLREAVLSALNQTAPPCEIIIVNDGSDASCVPDIDALKRLSPILRVYHSSQNHGPAFSRNVGLMEARGEVIHFMDDDDLLHPEMYESGLNMLRKDQEIGAVIFQCDMILPRNNGEGLESPTGVDGEYNYVEIPHPMRLMQQKLLNQDPILAILLYWPMIPTFMVRRSTIGATRFPEDVRYAEDTFFWVQLASRGVQFRMDGRALVHIRKHAGNVSHQPTYTGGMIDFHWKMLASGLLQNRHHIFITHARLLLKLLENGDRAWLKHLGHVLLRPDLCLKYAVLYLFTWPRTSQYH
jgi:glycosyltransferase involved in cell wall biosynthesis